jgi:hypothetical protein
MVTLILLVTFGESKVKRYFCAHKKAHKSGIVTLMKLLLIMK